jgi:hypothetical protein
MGSLPIDLENMMNQPEGYVPLVVEADHDTSLPTGLMDCGHHFNDIPRDVRRRYMRDQSAQIPRDILHNIVIDSNMAHPSTNIRRQSL